MRTGGILRAAGVAGIAAAIVLRACTVPAMASGAGGRGGAAGSPAGFDWLQFGGDPAHGLVNSAERALTAATVHALAPRFHTQLPGVADGAPVYASGVPTPDGPRDILAVTTRDGDIVVVDGRSGAIIWSRSHPAGSFTINGGGVPVYTTASPVIDPDRQYLYTYGLDGYVHKHRLADGVEVTGGGWPELATLKPWDEKGSSDLAIATDAQGVSRLYVTNGGYPGDRGDYQGHVTVIDLSDGSQRVFNATDSSQAVHFVAAPGKPDSAEVQSAVWARAGVVYDAKTDRILFATGNGTFDPARHAWGDSVLALAPDGRGAGGQPPGPGARDGGPLDSYTPRDFQHLDDTDADLGSTAPALLPPTDGRLLAVQGGKDELLRLLDREHLSGRAGIGHTGGEVQVIGVPGLGGLVLTQPAVWTDPRTGAVWVYVSTSREVAALQLEAGGPSPRLVPRWTRVGSATSPLVAGGALFLASSGWLRALDPTTGATLWENRRIGGIHWESPIVVDGRLYLTDESGALWAFALTDAS